jgi:glycosyltransferase involved in cell wall biosynthesis
MCKVSVVLPVYNVAAYIKDTIESLLCQTFKDFELLILDDCSTDNTVAQIRSFTDPRIRLILNPHNMGRAGTDNAALAYVRGEYLAKMDGDDICHPERLAQQVAYLDQHPEVNIVGSFMQNFGASTYLNRYPALPADTRVLTLFTLPTGNPSIMMRASLFLQDGMRYDATLRQTEDYDFCARYIRQLQIATLQEPLIQYRVPLDAHKKDILKERADVSGLVRKQLLRQWGMKFSEREFAAYNFTAMLNCPSQDISLAEIAACLEKIIEYNEKVPLFDKDALERGVGQRWFEACYRYNQLHKGNATNYYQSSLSRYAPISIRQHIKLWLQILRY